MSLFSTKLQALKFVVKQSIFAFCLLLGTIAANAQSLTNAQLTTLKACINAVPEWAALPNNSDTASTIASGLNQTANPAWIVWRGDVSRDDVTGDGFDWTQVDNLTTGQARIWELIFQTQTGRINFGDAGKRAGISEAWKGTAAKVAVATFIFSQAKRSATSGEKCLSTGTGTTLSPAVMGYEGAFNYQQVEAARALP